MILRVRTIARISAMLAVALVPPILVAMVWGSLRTWQPLGIQGLVITNDIGVYFRSSSWVNGGGSLYVNVPSEYPLFADLLFALARLFSDVWNSQPTAALSYEVTWVTFGWWMWLGVLLLLWRNAPRRTIWLWLNPATLYFSLWGYDVFLVATVLLALLAARDGRIRTAALWLGVTVALKGFALFAVPAFAVWVWRNRDGRQAALAATIAVAPLALSLAFIFVTSGMTAMLYPFRFQAVRGPDGESSTWDVLIPFGLGTKLARKLPLLPFALEAASAVIAALMRPKTFEQFVRAYLVAVGGFLTFSVFYSPQYVLWLAAPVALSGSMSMVAATVVLAWVTLLYFPITYFMPHARLPFRSAMLLVTVVRTTVIALALIPPRRLADTAQAVRIRLGA